MKQADRQHDPTNAQAKGKNWGVFDFCNQFLQTEDDLEQAAAEVCLRCHELRVVLVELRFCPLLHTLGSLTAARVIEAVVRGVRRCHSTQRSGVIICGLRSHEPARVLEMAHLARTYYGRGVVGFDLAGDEGSFSLGLHQQAIEYCTSAGVPVTVHAGEWPGTAHNVDLALQLGVQRIGHGWAMVADPALMARVAAAGVTVEVCLTSNVKPGAANGWVQSYTAHPVRIMFDAGVRVALSSDNLMLSGSGDRAADATQELVRLVDDCGFSWDEARTVLCNGARGAFMPAAERDAFVAEYEAAVALAFDTGSVPHCRPSETELSPDR